ncbi:MAG TPA: hypothetical protein ENK91_00650 [Bacteroidetes bacterium]|nr:hypothetical protein [Bacteroidota bacterium]
MKHLYFIFIFFFTSLLGQRNVDHNIQTGLVLNLNSLDLKTGDMAFFQNQTFYGKLTQIGTLSPFTHTAMVVVSDSGEILLTHSTLNDYNGYSIPVIDKKESYSGTILTRFDDLFLSLDNGKSGFYKTIWIRKLKDSKLNRPTAKEILKLYSKYKNTPFEPSNLHFILSAFDLIIFHYDLLKSPNDNTFMCSEYIAHLFKDLSFPIHSKEPPREITPSDIYKLLGDYFEDPIVFGFKNGLYHIIDVK